MSLTKDQVFKKFIIREQVGSVIIAREIEIADAELYHKASNITPAAEIKVHNNADLLKILNGSESLRRVLASNIEAASNGVMPQEQAMEILSNLKPIYPDVPKKEGFFKRLLGKFYAR